MPLRLISGLPNTGRTEVLREEFESAARKGRNPVLLVPSVDDVFVWERRLTRPDPEAGSGSDAGAGGFAGGRIVHFLDLCREVVRAADGKVDPLAGEVRRRLLLESAVEATADVEGGPAARVSGRAEALPGLLDATLELVDEFRAERIALRERPGSADGEEQPTIDVTALENGIEGLVESYSGLLADAGLSDPPSIAERAIEVARGSDPSHSPWGDSPLFIAGFDDMTGQQLEMVRRLARDLEVEVTMAITWQKDHQTGFLTDRLKGRLGEYIGIDAEDHPQAAPPGPEGGAESGTDSPDPGLIALAAAFFRGDAVGSVRPNPPVTLIRAAGERKEAEAIGAEIAALLDAGKALPDQIAIAHTDPSGSGRLLESVLRRYGIPATLETETAALSTTVGATIAALLRASGPEGTAEDLIVWLRGPLGPPPEDVDRIELTCRRRGIGSAGKALEEAVPSEDRGLWAEMFDRQVRRGPDRLRLVAQLARAAGRKVLENATSYRGAGAEAAGRPTPEVELEARMSEALASSAEDLAAAEADGRDRTGLLLDSMRRGEISVWTVPTKGTVRIAGPWGLRGKRVRFLFVAGLQEGGTRDLTRAGPFMSSRQRKGLEMLERVDPEVQARYLMFSCLSVPTGHLWLSCITSDDGGKSAAPSPLIAEIEALCAEPLEVIERSGSDTTFGPGSAPTAAELTRALATTGLDPDRVKVDRPTAAEVRERLDRARALDERSREFGAITDPEVLAALEATETFSPSEIEAWIACPWTWFLDRRIRPGRFGRDEVYMAGGTLVHQVLEALYGNHRGERPEPETVADWVAEVPGLFAEKLAEDGDNPLAGDDPEIMLSRLALERGVVAFLEREAERASPDFIPMGFEIHLDDIAMDGWNLRGRVDRLDTEAGAEPGPGTKSLVIDYKTGKVGAEFSASALARKGKVQILLYMEAMRRALGIDPVAGFVLPTKEGADPRPRGAIPSGAEEVIGGRGAVKPDLVEVEDRIDEAIELANGAVGEIRTGALEHGEGGCMKHPEEKRSLLPPLRPQATVEFESRPAPRKRERPRPDLTEDGGIEFTVEQQRVIESDRSQIMVSAAAGSGKTTVTVERYKRLLTDPEAPADPGSILVFTFTDQAAAKLREEVRAARASVAGGAAAVSMSDAWVGTFHSICSRILTAYPLEADVDPGFTVIDEITAATLRRQAFDRALSRRLTPTDTEDPAGAARRSAILGQIPTTTLRKTVEGIYDQLRSRGEEFPSIDPDLPVPDYPKKEMEDLAKEIDRALLRDDISYFGDKQREKCREIAALIRGPLGDRLTGWDFNEGRFDNQDLGKKTNVISLWDGIQKDLFERDGQPWLAEFALLLGEFGRIYAELKEGRAALDFEDLQIKALQLLERNDAVRADYASRFVEIMVDEFQDTNPLQMKLIEALMGGGSEAARLMTVGDEMQAIYRFRHADVGIFRERRSRLAAGDEAGQLIDLPDNYRSRAGIIEAVNFLGERIHPNPDRDGEAPVAFTKLRPGREGGEPGPRVDLLLTPKGGWDGLDLGPLCPADSKLTAGPRATVAEALALAGHIRELVESGSYSQRDVAVLLRVTTELPTFEAALNQFGLRTVVPSSKGFWDSHPVRDVIALLSVVANPLDDEAVVQALTCPACGVGPDGLWKVREAAGKNGALWDGVRKLVQAEGDGDGIPAHGPEGDLTAMAGFHRQVEEARRGLERRPLEATVSDLLEGTGLDLAYLRRDRTSLASLERIATLAGEYESQEGRDLRGFLAWAAASRESDAEAAIAVSGEDDDAVKIMTIHRSKGLEFPVVCVADLGRGLGDREKGPLRIGPEDDEGRTAIGLRLPGSNTGLFEWDEVVGPSTRENEAEELRLLHVAMTRAEDLLVLSGVAAKPGGSTPKSSHSALHRIMGILGLDAGKPGEWETELDAHGHSDLFRIVANLPGDGKAPKSLLESHPIVEEVEASDRLEPPLKRPERAFFPDVPLSFSGLLEFEECPARFFAKRVLRMDLPNNSDPGWSGPETTTMTERDGGTMFGTAVHDLLEKSSAEGWRVPGEAEVRDALKAAGVVEDLDSGVEAAGAMIKGFLDSDLGKMVRDRAARVQAEVPIVLGIGGLTIRGFVDLLADDGEDLWVVDYKTNSLDGKNPGDLMVTYSRQRDLYALAIARAEGRESVKTAFVFLEDPDSPVLKTYGADDFDAVEERLRSEVVEPITRAAYFGGGGPEPCGECEACRLLGLSKV